MDENTKAEDRMILELNGPCEAGQVGPCTEVLKDGWCRVHGQVVRP